MNAINLFARRVSWKGEEPLKAKDVIPTDPAKAPVDIAVVEAPVKARVKLRRAPLPKKATKKHRVDIPL